MQHILASLNDPSIGSGQAGRAAIVLDTGPASRGSGNANTNKEKDVRRWFVEQDFIEGVIYLPENLFYNTTAPGIILFLNKAKTKERKGKLFLLNAATEFAKGDPKNYIPEDAITRIADTFKAWREVEKYSRIVSREDRLEVTELVFSHRRPTIPFWLSRSSELAMSSSSALVIPEHPVLCQRNTMAQIVSIWSSPALGSK